jgi:hypothetical protein
MQRVDFVLERLKKNKKWLEMALVSGGAADEQRKVSETRNLVLELGDVVSLCSEVAHAPGHLP